MHAADGMMKKTYRGSCHCGAVRFECDLDLAAGSRKCNCSFCTKSRFWKAFASAGRFRLLAGESALSQYTFGDARVVHCFCSRCGVRLFGHVRLDRDSDVHAVNVACLDDVDDFTSAPLRYENGRDDNWWSVPRVTAHL